MSERMNFCDVFEDVTKQGRKLQTSEYFEKGLYPIYDQGKNEIAGYTNETEGLFTDVPVILFGDHTRIVKYVNQSCFLGADGVKLLKPKLSNVNAKYLYYAVRSIPVPDTGYNRHFKWLKESTISIPNEKEQEKTVDILEKTEELISLRKKQLHKLDDLVKARFVEMFGAPHRSKRYSYHKISELTDVISGGTPDRKNGAYWNDGTIPWVKTTELNNGIITNVEECITEKGLSESSAKIVPASTVLIAMYGQGKTRGMTGLLGIEACTNQACACILPTSKIDMQYLWHFLILSYIELRGLAQGGNQPNLNVGMIKDFPILLPPMKEQRQFVSFVSQVNQSKLSIQQSLEKLETLKQSLMQQYFG